MHGVASVQARHYNGPYYRLEKLGALEVLLLLLDAPEAVNVVSLVRSAQPHIKQRVLNVFDKN